MKNVPRPNPRQDARAERSLYEAILTLQSVDECRAFFKDLCTPAELEAMSDRWVVVEWLRRNLPYREIHKRTGVSVTTIGRVARYLGSGNGGYDIAMSRIEANRSAATDPR
jgi:TrpR-related protein YerC/YecD